MIVIIPDAPDKILDKFKETNHKFICRDCITVKDFSIINLWIIINLDAIDYIKDREETILYLAYIPKLHLISSSFHRIKFWKHLTTYPNWDNFLARNFFV